MKLLITLIFVIAFPYVAVALDADNDGYSNFYDADFNNDGIVNFADLGEFRLIFGSTNPVGDLNSDGRVNFADLARFRQLFGKPPGGTATLTWTAPSLNEDNSPLTDLAGYKVYTVNDLTQPWVFESDVAGTTLFIDSLKIGTWHYIVTAVDVVGNESVFSETVMKVIE